MASYIVVETYSAILYRSRDLLSGRSKNVWATGLCDIVLIQDRLLDRRAHRGLQDNHALIRKRERDEL